MRYSVLLLLLAGACGWLAWHQADQQRQLCQQLAELTAVLAIENDLTMHTAQSIFKDMEVAAAKNRNQPADLTVLHQAAAVQAGAAHLVAALRAYDEQLRRTAGNAETGPLRHAGAPLGPDARPGHALAQQLGAYAQLLRQADPAPHAAPLLLPPAPASLAEALADLSQLESEVLARQTRALRRLAKKVGARHWPTHPLAITAAESNVVAPGGTYRAELGLVNYFSAAELNMHMSCNGQPVWVGPDGVGLVRFRAPRQPGPASWMGKIYLRQNGRDTTFAVRVPYRVARR
jgi:hypothetical protein